MVSSFKFTEWRNGPLTIRGSLHLHNNGNSPWVIFAHGFTGQRMGPNYLFVKISRALENAGISSLRFDFTGSGESDGLFSDMTVESMLSDFHSAVVYVRKHFAWTNLIILGHSLGGLICSLNALICGADGLILLAPVAKPMSLVVRRKKVLEKGPNKKGFFENGPHEMKLSFLDSLKEVDPIEILTGYKKPLLLFQGSEDESVSVKESGYYVHWARKAGIDTEYHILPNADHNFSTVSDVNMLCSTISTWTKERYL